MKKKYWILVIVIVLVVAGIYLSFNKKEDLTGSTIEKTEKEKTAEAEEGETNLILEQQKAIVQARELYAQKRQEGMRFESQCLGTVGDQIKYAVDIVHVPRNAEDDLIENQCSDFRTGKIRHFVELDRGGNIFRIF